MSKTFFTWAMQDIKGSVYYCCENFFGIQTMGVQVISGECTKEDCVEIAHQLFAQMKGWV